MVASVDVTLLPSSAQVGIEVESLIYRDEIHGFLDERNRIDFHTRLASFFERHLAPRSSAAAAVCAPH